MTVALIKGRYIPNGRGVVVKLRDALRYMERRRLGPEERPEDRGLFDAERGEISRREAEVSIRAHADRRVAYHRLILSPGIEIADLQRWTRLVMTDLGHRQGQDLHWVAVAHRNTAHPHVHLLLAGAGAWRPMGGRRSRPGVAGDPAAKRHAFLREAGDRRAREVARDERGCWDAVRGELDPALGRLAGALADELTREDELGARHPPEATRGAGHPAATPREMSASEMGIHDGQAWARPAPLGAGNCAVGCGWRRCCGCNRRYGCPTAK